MTVPSLCCVCLCCVYLTWKKHTPRFEWQYLPILIGWRYRFLWAPATTAMRGVTAVAENNLCLLQMEQANWGSSSECMSKWKCYCEAILKCFPFFVLWTCFEQLLLFWGKKTVVLSDVCSHKRSLEWADSVTCHERPLFWWLQLPIRWTLMKVDLS